MKILITGGAGFIGSSVALSLLKDGHTVYCIDNLAYGYKENLTISNTSLRRALKFIQVDIRDTKIHSLLKGIDVLYHFAAISSLPECQNNPSEAISVNVAGTANILEAARKQGVKRIIFSSTSAVYENEQKFPTPESASTLPTLVYSLTKKQAEDLCIAYRTMYAMDIVILRFFNVYGPHMDSARPNPPVVCYIADCLRKNVRPSLHSDGNQKRDTIYIDDVIDLCKIVLRSREAKNETLNVGSGKAYSINDVFRHICDILHISHIKPRYKKSSTLWSLYPNLQKGPQPLDKSFIEKETNKHTLASTVHTQKITHWIARTSLAEGLKKTLL